MLEVPFQPPEARPPWDLNWAERMQTFRSAPAKIAYYVDDFRTSSFRYRVYNMVAAINKYLAGASATWFLASDGEKALLAIKEADVLVIHRTMYSERVAELIFIAQQKGIKVFFDIDDALFDPKLVPLMISSLDEYPKGPDTSTEAILNTWFASFARYRYTMEMCDGIIVTNQYLADQAAAVTGLPTYVIPNFMGDDQVANATALYESRTAAGNVSIDGRLSIGYFSGSPSHRRDFGLAAPAIADILRRHDDVTLRIVGYLGLSGTPLEKFTHQVELIPPTDYFNLQRIIAETEIHIAPLLDNEFTNAKSELKFIDAALVGIPTLASPTFTMSQAINESLAGRIVPDGDWYEALERAITTFRPTGLAEGQKAREYALAKYSAPAQVAAIKQALGI